MTQAMQILGAINAALIAVTAVYQASPGAGMPQEVLVGLLAVSAGLSGFVAFMARAES